MNQPQPVQQPMTPQGGTSKWLWIILIIVVLVVAGLLGWQKLRPKTSSTTTSTAEWKTYTNKDYDLSFKYPQNNTISSNRASTNYTVGWVIEAANQSGPTITLDIQTDSIDNYWKQENLVNDPKSIKTYEGLVVKDIVVGANKDIKAKQIKFHPERTRDDIYTFRVIFVQNKKLYIFEETSFNSDVLNQLVSTINFTTPIDQTPPPPPSYDPTTSTISTADWKTYKNSQFGYKIKYPADWVVKDNNCAVTSDLCGQYIASYSYTNMTGQDVVANNPKNSPNGIIFTVNVSPNPKKLSAAEYLAGTNATVQKININGNDFIVEMFGGPYNPTNGVTYSVVKADKFFRIAGNLFEKNNETMPQAESVKFKDNFNAMLSTFQFTK